MKMQAYNPYLPFWETVPDGEPHVFGDRVYIFGSHDELGGANFCLDDYVGWSAPVKDLGNWQYEGIIYRKEQDPINGAPYDGEIPHYDMVFEGGRKHLLYAPDVAQGPDGRYYLYYSLDFTGIISVAVADKPAGPYEFLAYVTRADGSRPEIGQWFDPAILSEKSGNFLYYGFAPAFRFPGMEKREIPGGLVVRLADDMHTIIGEPHVTANGCDTAKGTGFEPHPFFEASSIRHFGDWYYFVYSTLQGNELGYAMSKSPEGPFEFKGVLHSNGDLGVDGNTVRTFYTGNNHGGIVKIGEDYYIFGHRHTHGTGYSRQGVAEKLTMNPDGTFNQAEMTSCGLNGGPLKAEGTYSAYIACHLTGPNGAGDVVMTGPEGGDLTLPKDMPFITEETRTEGIPGSWPLIRNLQKGAVCGFKYFEFQGSASLSLTVRGKAVIGLSLSKEGPVLASGEVNSETWTKVLLKPVEAPKIKDQEEALELEGVHPVFFRVLSGECDLAEFSFLA